MSDGVVGSAGFTDVRAVISDVVEVGITVDAAVELEPRSRVVSVKLLLGIVELVGSIEVLNIVLKDSSVVSELSVVGRLSVVGESVFSFVVGRVEVEESELSVVVDRLEVRVSVVGSKVDSVGSEVLSVPLPSVVGDVT